MLILNSITFKDNGEEVKVEYDFNERSLRRYPVYGTKYGTLKIDNINLNLPIYYGDNMRLLNYGVGHYAGSYFPGENGSIIFVAHNTPGYFDRIIELNKGDKIVVEATYGTFTYEVDSAKVVHETDLSAFPIQHDKEMLIMYTCYPIDRNFYGRKTQRYVLYAYKVGDSFE